MPRIIHIMLAGLFVLGCTPKVAPNGPGTEPDVEKGVVTPEVKVSAPARQVLVGEMCPEGAAGRPAVMPLFMRGIGWLTGNDDVSTPIETRAAKQFSVYAWDGRRAGIFSVAGSADIGLDRRAAVGGYAGVSPCVGPAREDGEDRIEDVSCVKSQAHCGLAMAVLEAPSGYGARPFEEDPDPASFPTGGACANDDKLLVDVDGDGTLEAYPLEQFLDPVRAPAVEVVSVDRGGASCEPAFASRNVIPEGDPRHWRGLSLLGVVDVDGDGRNEIIVSFHYSDRRTWAIYSATGSVGRLDLVGESVPWPRN